MRILISSLALSFFLVSCVDPFSISEVLKDQASQPVINGWISNFPHDYRIYVSRAVALDDPSTVEVATDATVLLKSGSGDSFKALFNSRDQNYSLPNLFAGKEGETYWVEVTFSNGEVFQSTPQVLLTTTTIESLNYGNRLGFNNP